ncbi:uncharacterized protein JCM15063_004533 [Sporobolomyces koalae]|uniref:uncharacterized protein n=1 Tax=Sporobolomyces koalae TaxID=500713 RepID=UPI0031750081
MRRIFGGTALAGSSTSNSLSSDAVSSPVSPTHERSPPLTPVYETHFRRDEEGEQQKKGWFGGLVRTSSTTNTTATGAGDSRHHAADSTRTNPLPGGSTYEDLDAERLPFGGSRSPSALVSSPRNGHFRQTSRSSASLGSAFGGSSSRPFSPDGGLAEGQATVPKDAIMIELLSGQAAIEAKDYDVLDWDQVQELKKEHSLLAKRIASLTRSVALETRLRDSAAKLVRLTVPASTAEPSRTPISSPTRRHVSQEQAEAQLATAQTKLDTVQGELYKVGWKESEIRTKLLKHTAGVLALSTRKKQEEEQRLAAGPLSPTLPQHGTASSSSHESPSPAGPNADLRFDGAHFFSGNREAVIPTARSQSSPFASPNPTQGAFPPVNLQHQQDQIHDLESQVRRLEAEKAQVKLEHDRIQHELDNAIAGASQEKARSATLEADVTSLRQGLERAEEDVSRARQEAETIRHDVSLARSTSTTHERDLELARDEVREAGDKARELELELEELETKLAEAEQKVGQLETEVQEVRQEQVAGEKAWAERLEQAERHNNRELPDETEESLGEQEAKQRVRELEDDNRKMVQAVGDVLRRHRMRPVLGSALRETPSFDDTTSRHDLPSYLASTLDAHFDKVASHVTHLDEQLSTTRSDMDATRSSLDTELNEASERHSALENEIEALRIEKDLLRESLDSAHAQSRATETRLESIPILEQNLSAAISNETKTREEFTALQAKISTLESQLAEVTEVHGKSYKVLQDLFKALPPLDTRPLPEHGADDLGSLKNAFDPNARRQLGNFIADITSSGGKFSVEGLAERIKLLLAEDQKVVQRLAAFESEKTAFDKTRKAVEERSAELHSNERKIKDLEERIEVSSQQEVTMLERLNDLTESLEQTRLEKRKLETQVSQLQAQVQAHGATASSSSASNVDTEELLDQIADLEEELKDAKAREQKVRSQLLDELSTVQSEVSSLKTQLRQAQRKAGK